METSVKPPTSLRPLTWVLLITLVCLLPFINKPFHIDDPLFLRAAAQIQRHPADFYGFTMNWLGTPLPMVKDFDNPPLTCYYLALAAAVIGWSETALHLAFLLPALASAWGIFALARRFSRHPLLAAVIAVLTPVFLISATTLMCDVMCLAFWVWAVVTFEKGLEHNDWKWLLAAGGLAGLATLTKFTGLALVPLLAFYALARQRKPGRWLVALLIPVIFAAGYEWITRRLYGQGMLLAAGSFACGRPLGRTRWLIGKGIDWSGIFGRLLPAGAVLSPIDLVAAVGGPLAGVAGALCGRAVLAAPLQTVAGAGRTFEYGPVFGNSGVPGRWHFGPAAGRRGLPSSPRRRFAVAGIVGPGSGDVYGGSQLDHQRSQPVAGPARRRHPPGAPTRCAGIKITAVAPGVAVRTGLLAAALSLMLTRADARLAETNRRAAEQLWIQYHQPGNTVWFEGHWGFQYYLEKAGGKAIDLNDPKKASGDILIIPANASNLYEPPMDLVRLLAKVDYLPDAHCATMNNLAGAGFYASVHGPLPFVIGQIEPDRFYIFQYQ